MMEVPRVLNPDYSTSLLKKMLILHRQALFMLNIERSTVVCEDIYLLEASLDIDGM